MTDYFGYDVHFVMNITDIDDKVCKLAPFSHSSHCVLVAILFIFKTEHCHVFSPPIMSQYRPPPFIFSRAGYRAKPRHFLCPLYFMRYPPGRNCAFGCGFCSNTPENTPWSDGGFYRFSLDVTCRSSCAPDTIT